MSSCPHGFELTQVSCPAGCGGTSLRQSAIGTGRAQKPEPKSPRRNFAALTDQEIELALTDATSVREEREKLSVQDIKFLARCRAVPKLWALYEAAKARGLSTGRCNWRGY